MTTIDPAQDQSSHDQSPHDRTSEAELSVTTGSPSRGTGTRATRLLGIGTIVAMAWLVAFGLGFSPADRDQQESVRILYVHVPTIWLAYLAFTVTAFASAMYLFTKKKSLGWDRVAGASADTQSVYAMRLFAGREYRTIVIHDDKFTGVSAITTLITQCDERARVSS